jgi:hypothetical protein
LTFLIPLCSPFCQTFISEKGWLLSFLCGGWLLLLVVRAMKACSDGFFSLIWRRDDVDTTNFRVNVGCFNEGKRGWSTTSCFVKKKLLTMDMMLSEIITCGYKWHWWWRDEEKRGYQFFFFFFYLFFSKQILFLL